MSSISDLAREASLSSKELRRGRQTYATDSVGGFSLRSRSLMRLRGRVSAKLIRNLSDPDRLSCSLTRDGVRQPAVRPHAGEVGRQGSQRSGRGPWGRVVALLPARPDTSYWHDHVAGHATVYFFRGRLRLGDGQQRAPFPSALAVWGASRETLAALDAALPKRGAKGDLTVPGQLPRSVGLPRPMVPCAFAGSITVRIKRDIRAEPCQDRSPPGAAGRARRRMARGGKPRNWNRWDFVSAWMVPAWLWSSPHHESVHLRSRCDWSPPIPSRRRARGRRGALLHSTPVCTTDDRGLDPAQRRRC